jgi:competence protein ComEA
LKYNIDNMGKAGLIALSLFFAIGTSHAYMQKSEALTQSSNKIDKSKPAIKKIIDINRASKAELKTLQGVDEVLAAKIIAGRPYLSKANLVTHNILPAGLYMQLKQQIIAKQ